MSEDTVRVAVRIRPLIKTEIEKGCQMCIDVVPGEPQIQIRNTDKAFRYNHVFSPDVSQEEFYNNAIKGMVENIFRGYNVTILAYGQTGSGKTHSMGTDYNGAENVGVIPRAVQNIFNIISSKADWSFSVTVSFMELYQEQLYDLLSDKQRHQSIVDIREGSKGIQVVGITEKEVTSAEEALQCLTEGSLGRATGATAMNAHSSRSHAIFTLSIHQQKTDDPNTATIAKFHLVDLAGSERSKKTQATGERFKEGVNINKGLLALGNVISQLGEGGPLSHISYRDSKLTRLLQDSLGGNSMTLMIACVSPADYNLDETLSTLRYADRALKIKNKPIVNQDPKSSEINRLNKLVQELKLALVSQDMGGVCPPEHQRLQEKVLSLQQRIRDLTEQINSYLIEIVAMHERAELAENTREKVQSHMEQILEDCKQCLESLEAGPTKDKDPYNELKAIYLKILGIHTDQKKASEELLNYDVSLNSQSAAVNSEEAQAVSKDDSSNSLEEFDVKHEEHTLRQAERNNEVMNINRELAIKESLVCKLLKNSMHIVDQTKELQEMEHEIKTLQAEKEELVQALQNAHTSNASSKLAEARRKKVQELEKKITELSRKCTEQSKVIKTKEKQDQQIKSLSNEIHLLKQTRVKLVRQMRNESDKFTKWKQCREKELNKLRDQDRKRVNEMTRLKMQHDKQETVFKRKMEEAFAINKRLKDALDLQKRAAQSKERASNMKDNLQTWLNQELEILVSTVDAESSLQKLMQDRASLAAQLEKLKGNSGGASKEEIAGLTEFLELRNAQITDLQQKILESDQENRANTRFRSIHSMAEAKSALKILFDITAEDRKKQREEIIKLKEELQTYKERCELQERRALAEINSNSGNNYLTPAKPRSRKTERTMKESFDVNQSPVSDDSIVEDDVDKDPDWTKTPLYKRLQKLSNVSKNSSHDRTQLKRSSDGEVKCACKTNCASRLCSCRKNDTVCSNCNCNPNTCQNRDKENLTRTLFVDNDNTSDTSKRARYDAEKTFIVTD